MTTPVMVVRPARHGGADLGRHLWTWCPGCEKAHRHVIAPVDGTVPPGAVWDWDGNLAAPTITPSLLTRGGHQGSDHVCHSFIRAGQWEFLSDCTHALAGTTVPMVPLPDWLVR